MFLIGEDYVVSEEILQNKFVCDLNKCKGACCVEGTYGAPLEKDEVEIIKNNLAKIIPFMESKSIEFLNENGFFEEDPDGDIVTTCLNGADCVFAIQENGIHKCAIEKSYLSGAIDFKKPISCHLYPIRISSLKKYVALNYSEWDVCSPACTLGENLQVPVYQFLKEPIIRKFGNSFYEELELISTELNKNNTLNKS